MVDAADSVVYDVHDLDDAFGVNLIDLNDLKALAFWQKAERELTAQHGILPTSRLIPTVLRYVLSQREREMLSTTQRRIQEAGVSNVKEVKALREPLVKEGQALEGANRELRQFLHEKVYRHPRVLEMSLRGKSIVRGLYDGYRANPGLMPEYHAIRAKEIDCARAVGDYVAGMTDRLAALEYGQLFQTHEKSDMIETLS